MPVSCAVSLVKSIVWHNDMTARDGVAFAADWPWHDLAVTPTFVLALLRLTRRCTFLIQFPPHCKDERRKHQLGEHEPVEYGNK